MNIHVEQFQSIADAALMAEGFTAVTGPSNRGKSSLVRAISGALFNRAGDEFVRLGATSTRVTLSDLQGHVVTWMKGHGVNKFEIDGETYDKVGSGSPDRLQAFGYRDLWIGDEARGRGETIRPQIAQQFDGLFLLGRTGSFIAEVIARISRVMVLQRAHGRSSADLKAEKGLRTIRERDLEAAEAALTLLLPIRALDTRVALLGEQVYARGVAEAKAQQVRGLIARRTTMAALAQRVLPTPVELPNQIQVAVKLLPALHARIARRTTLLALLQRPLPPRLQAPALDAMTASVVALRRHVGTRAGATVQLHRAKSAAKAAADEELRVQEEYALAFSMLKVCPLCERAL